MINILILETDKGFAIAIIAVDKRLDFKAVARHFSCKKVRLASAERVKEFSDYEAGNIPTIIFEGKCLILVSRFLEDKSTLVGSADDQFYGLLLQAQVFRLLGYCLMTLASRQR